MRPEIRHRPLPPPPPVSSCASDPSAHEVDPRPPVARLTDPALRKALLGYARACRVPEREVEDVVQKALANAWAQQASWPESRFGLERWMCTITHHRAIDTHRDLSRRPLARTFESPDTLTYEPPDPTGDEGGDDGEVGGMVTSPDPVEMREGLARAAEHVAKHPSMKRAFGWTLRSIAGESYADIAAADDVSERTVADAIKYLRQRLREALPDVMMLFITLAFALVLLRALHPKHEEAVPAPEPEHSIVAPTPPNLVEARQIRTRALAECDGAEYDACLADLDRAQALDPAGDADERVQEARRTALERLTVGHK